MSDIFTTVTVILTPEFVNSFPHARLQTKLRNLRLVTGVQFSKTHALHGKWYQVDAAFEILNHWSKYPDHEPNLHESSSCDKKIICDCQQIKDLLNEISLKLANESEIASGALIKSDTVGISINTVRVKRDIDSLKKELELSNVNSGKDITCPVKNNCAIDQEISNKPLHHKCEEKKVMKTELSADYISTNINDPMKINQNLSENAFDYHYSETGYGISTTETSFSTSTKTIDQEENNAVSGKHQNTKRKPGEEGYWSRLKREDNHLEHICSQCGVVLKSRKRYLEHVRRMHTKEYKCDVCLKGFGYPSDLKHHNCTSTNTRDTLESKEDTKPKTKQQRLPCTLCNYKTVSAEKLNRHVKVKHSSNNYCEECNVLFDESKGLKQHQKTVHNNVIFVCDQCSKCYKSKVNFELHMKTHEDNYEKPTFLCTVCGKSFTTKNVLTMHHKSEHLGIKKTYLCPICGKKFSNRNSYKQHANVHYGIKPYKCEICEQAFTYHKSLREHKFMHDNIRRFKCDTCGKTFRQRTTLHIHKKTHNLVKDHVCHCGKEFSQKQSLERHERIHSGVKPFKCEHCEKSFSDSTTIRRHMIAIHHEAELNWQDNVICTVKKKSDYYIIGGNGHNRKCSKSKKLGTNAVVNQGIQETVASQNQSLSICNIPCSSLLKPVQMEPLYTNTSTMSRENLNLVKSTSAPVYAVPVSQVMQFKPVASGAVMNFDGVTTSQCTKLSSLNSSQTSVPASLPQMGTVHENQRQLPGNSDHLSSGVAMTESSDSAKSNSYIQLQPPLQILQSRSVGTLNNMPVLSFGSVSELPNVQHLVICSEENGIGTNLAGIVGFFQYPVYSTAVNGTTSTS